MMKILLPKPVAWATHLVLLFSVAFLRCDSNTEKISPEEEAAINSARYWIALIDSGQFDQSWQIATAEFKANVTQRQWRIGLEQIRVPYGRVKSHKIKSSRLSQRVTKGQRQKKCVVEFTTLFENQDTTTEFVTLLLDDTKWNVSAYYFNR
jgi:hypothetical protein